MDSRERITLRLKESNEQDVLMGLYFGGVFTHLERELGADATAEIKKEVLGGQTPLAFFRYPVTRFMSLLKHALERSKRPISGDDAFLRAVGRSIAEHNLSSPLAKTVATLSGGNPHKILSLVVSPAVVMSVNSFGTRKSEKTGERSATQTLKRELLGASVYPGLIEGLLELMGKTKAHAVISEVNPSGSDFVMKVSW
jgi:uncharacterized protein (TIGR02265 family)